MISTIGNLQGIADYNFPKSLYVKWLISKAACSALRLFMLGLLATLVQNAAFAQQVPKKLVSPAVNPKLVRLVNPAVQTALQPLPVDATFLLHSHPTATKRIYLNFIGHSTSGTSWNSGNTAIVTAPFSLDSDPAFSASELAAIRAIWMRVSECYSPFDVDVTTEEPPIQDLINSGGGDNRWGIRVLIGASSPDPAPGAGGVAFVGSFSWNTDTPCFVFPSRLSNTAKYIADASIHEVGHTLGLIHDGRVSPAEAYYAGHGSGPTGWAPHMGVGYYQNLVQWSKGEYLSANNQEDDLTIIATQNGFGYRPDDFPNDRSTAGEIAGTLGTGVNQNVYTVAQKGIISTRTDSDWFKLTIGGGQLTLNATGGTLNTMLDMQMDLYSSSGTLITSVNPPEELSATLSQTVSAGVYYVKIDGVGKGSALGTGYTDYSSLGTYTISGTFTKTPVSTLKSKITVAYSATEKTLTLKGDAKANSLTISLQSGSLRVQGANGTSIEVKGTNGSTVTSASTTFQHTGKLTINADLGDGDDAIAVIGVDSSSSNITLGAGNDQAAITLCNIEKLNVDGGPGTDILVVTSSSITKLNKLNIP